MQATGMLILSIDQVGRKYKQPAKWVDLCFEDKLWFYNWTHDDSS